jgi:hypothetical protein
VTDDILGCLAEGTRFPLRDVAQAALAKLPGIYALWHDGDLLYVGIARVDPKDTNNPQAAGVPGRLNTYRRCRLTSDFALGCALRYVIPHLSDEQRSSLGDGTMTMRHLPAQVRDWVWTHVTFSAVTSDAPLAIAAERIVRSNGLPGVGLPAFNPA